MTQVWFDALVRASGQGAILALAVWLVLAAWKQPWPSVRAGLWLLAAAKFLLGLFFVVSVPVLPAGPAVAAAEVEGLAPAAVFEWKAVLVGAWAAGTIVVAMWAMAGTRRLRRLVRESRLADMPVRDAWVAAGGRAETEVRTHPRAEMPMVIGLVRPVVLLPDALLTQLDEDELRMVLAHENAHLKRRDALASIPMFACFALFYFHPLVWLVQREWQRNREAACDTAAMAAVGADPRQYGQMLLKVSVSAKSTAVLALSAAPSFRTLHRRIKDMKHSSPNRRGNIAWTLLVMIFAAASIPLVLVERQVSVLTNDPITLPAQSGPLGPSPASPLSPLSAPQPARVVDPISAPASIEGVAAMPAQAGPVPPVDVANAANAPGRMPAQRRRGGAASPAEIAVPAQERGRAGSPVEIAVPAREPGRSAAPAEIAPARPGSPVEVTTPARAPGRSAAPARAGSPVDVASPAQERTIAPRADRKGPIAPASGSAAPAQVTRPRSDRVPSPGREVAATTNPLGPAQEGRGAAAPARTDPVRTAKRRGSVRTTRVRTRRANRSAPTVERTAPAVVPPKVDRKQTTS